MPPVKHALLGASAASRWLACTPSARLCEDIQDSGSQYAAEGTLAHELAELKVRKMFTVMAKSAYTKALNKIKKAPLYDSEMDRVTDSYLDYIKDCAMQFDSKPFVACEVNVNFSGYVPEGFGTADCVMIGGTTMRVVDFKYGKGVPVTAEENPQMKLYAIGALVQYAMLYHIDRVILTIAQLRLGEPDEWETTPDALIQWAAEYVKPRAELAYKGGGEPQPGEHCRFCKAKAQCRARAEDNLAAAQAFSSRADTSSPVDARLLTYPEIGRALERAKPFIKWFKDIEEYALQSALEGKEIPGWKVVEGRSRRQFDNTDTVFEELQAAGIDGALLYERKPLALTGIEELLGKKAFENLCGSHVVKSAGKPALVPEGDRRKPFNSAVADFEGLQEE
ncbi:DUF2800 domain-containing protein [Intestinibacillus massiliensis]